MSSIQGALWLMAATLAVIAAALGAASAAWLMRRANRAAISATVWRQR